MTAAQTLYCVPGARSHESRPTVAEDRGRYCGPKGEPDVRLECEREVDDLEMQRSALLRAGAGIPGAQLRPLSMRASAIVCSAED